VILFNVPEYLVPKPSTILSRLVETFPGLTDDLAVTSLEALGGFILGTMAGVTLAIVFAHSRVLEMAIYPYAIALKSMPVVALAPLLVVWFGNGVLPKVIVAAVISFFPVVVNTVRGLSEIDQEAFDLFDSLAATRVQVFLKLRVPTALPYLFAALRISATLAVIGAIVGEFAGADRGLGFNITIAAYRLDTVDMFVSIILSSLLGIGAFYFVALVERIVVPWSRNGTLVLG